MAQRVRQHQNQHRITIVLGLCFMFVVPLNLFLGFWLGETKDAHKLSGSVQFMESTEQSKLFGFTIRSAKRLLDIQYDPNLHIFDIVSVYDGNQLDAKSAQLFLDGKPIGNAICFTYSQSDNFLCVPLRHIKKYAKRYFVSTGVGMSGWIMSRAFCQEFVLQLQESAMGKKFASPDVIASKMLIKNQQWSVTRQYLVSHSVQTSVGVSPLNHNPANLSKHLPRCFEPHRGKWTFDDTGRDMHGWDYYDYERCNATVDALFPC